MSPDLESRLIIGRREKIKLLNGIEPEERNRGDHIVRIAVGSHHLSIGAVFVVAASGM